MTVSRDHRQSTQLRRRTGDVVEKRRFGLEHLVERETTEVGKMGDGSDEDREVGGGRRAFEEELLKRQS